jgi:ABC-type transport system involved in multi-copper enzyme maturation permease subunit
MTTATTTPYRSAMQPGREGFAQLLHAEWTKFRTVRGWVIGMLVAVLVTVLLGLLGPAGSHISCAGPNGQACSQDHTPPVGPDGEAVTDGFYFVHQPLAGDGSITVRVTSLTGLYHENGTGQVAQDPRAGMRSGTQPWSKAGIIIKQSTSQGSAYAAMMVTGSHGVRMQHNFTHDTAGLPGAVADASPRWLRLTRAGDTITGFASADGTNWSTVGTVSLAGLSSTVEAGLFTTSPEYTVTEQRFVGTSSRGGPTLATAHFDQVSIKGTWPRSEWTGEYVGGRGAGDGHLAGFQQDGGGFTVSGSGDIAPKVAGGAGSTIENSLVGAFAGLIAMIIVATLFITGEYRRGLIRTTFAASPRRGRVLAAKAIVIGSVTFVTGLAAAALAVPLVGQLARAKGIYVFPVTPLTELRVVVGTAALLAIAAVLALAVGTVLRRSAGAVTAVIVAIVLPYILAVASVLPAGVSEWLLRLTPAAAFAIQQSMPQYPQVTASYTPDMGYFPLAPWAGFAVLCGYAVLALGLATVVLRRRNA